MSGRALGHVSVIAIPRRRTIRPVVADMVGATMVNDIAIRAVPVAMSRVIVASPWCIVADLVCDAEVTMRR